jgi:Tfp pilus assembly pilus retraction ATPase PilT
MANAAVRNLIRDNKVAQLRNVMVTSSDEGMCTLEAALGWLVRSGMVSEADAVARSMFPDEVIRHRTPYVTHASVGVDEAGLPPPPASLLSA